jgi:transcriptional regulator with XRE-family HTH domain
MSTGVMARREEASSFSRSPSIDLLMQSLKAAEVSRRTFVNETGLSYEYVSRIFNNKVKFPAVRETLEKFAEVARIDPMQFVEYRQLVSVLPTSTRKLWAQLQHLGMSRQVFSAKVGISRTYMYEILRGDVPFPRNPEVIEKIAQAAQLDPEMFGEYLAPVQDWAERNPAAIEQVFMDLLVSKMLLSRGYGDFKSPASALSDDLMSIFPPDERFDATVRALMRVMGRERLSVRDVCDKAEVNDRDVRLLLMGQIHPEDLCETFARLTQVFQLKP